jgi:hypothetical protein
MSIGSGAVLDWNWEQWSMVTINTLQAIAFRMVFSISRIRKALSRKPEAM